MKLGNARSAAALAILLLMTLLPVGPMISGAGSGVFEGDIEEQEIADQLSSRLVSMGFRPRHPYHGSNFIQTPSPAPEGARIHPTGTASIEMHSSSTRYSWESYYSDDILDVYVDTSTSGGGSLSSQEETLLDAVITDFIDYSYPRVKDWYDPLNRVSSVTFYIHQIDGRSGTGGYYSPGTDEFHIDRADMDWAGEIAAHEFQHYIHDKYDRYENLWINEGMSDHAAFLVYGYASVLSSHLAVYFNYYPYTTLPIDDYSFYRDGTTRYYGVAFAYQLYMTHHYGGKNWSRALIRSSQSGISGVNSALSTLGHTDRFQDTFEKWMVASRVNDKDAGNNGEYSYATRNYPYGTLQTKLMGSYSGIPVESDGQIGPYGPQSFRFTSSAGSANTYRLSVEVSKGSLSFAVYPEVSTLPRQVTLINSDSGSAIFDLDGWGKDFQAFQVIVSTTSLADLSIELDILDLEPPVTMFGINPPLPDGDDGWFISKPLITMATESGATTHYRIDQGPEMLYNQPVYLDDGVHTFSYWSIDKKGNVEEARHVDLKIDTEVPKTSISIDPAVPDGYWYTATPTITLGTDHPDSSIHYRWDQEDFVLYSSPIKAPEGEHQLSWRAVDQAGNQETPGNMLFKVDTLRPTLSYSIYPSEPDGMNGWYASAPRITLSGDAQDTIYFAMGSNDYSRYSSGIVMPEGITNFRAVSMDQAGNRGEELLMQFKVDTIRPKLTWSMEGFNYMLDNASQWFNARPVIDIQSSEGGTSITYLLNDEERSYDGPIVIDEGHNEIWVHARDKAGNEAEPLFFIIKIDTKAPVVRSELGPPSDNGWYNDMNMKVELELVGEDDRSSPATLHYAWGDAEYRTYRDAIPVPEGINTLRYFARDSAGNVLKIESIEVKKDTIRPEAAMELVDVTNQTILVGGELIVDMSGSRDSTSNLQFQFDLGDGTIISWRSTSSASHSYSEAGTYTIKGWVKDSAGNVAEIERTINVVEEEIPAVDRETGTNPLLLAGGAVLLVLLLVIIALLAVILVRRRNA
ncbi:MAG: PKD domain-containing protein [Candidatus Thermoplasmatota archaeon]|nr:PKD domain-containing protein [Candidatus Thermoplasmatota archaeon]